MSIEKYADLESIQEARNLVAAAHAAFQAFEHFSEEQVERILAEISKVGAANAQSLARLAVEETGYGTVEHKTLKNLFCAEAVYKAIQPMKTIGKPMVFVFNLRGQLCLAVEGHSRVEF